MPSKIQISRNKLKYVALALFSYLLATIKSKTQKSETAKHKSQIGALDRRFLFVRLIIIASFLLLTFRLFQIQVLNTARYKAQAKQQQVKRTVIQPKRGNIFTSDGYAVAQSIPSFYISINRSRLVANNDYLQVKKILAMEDAEYYDFKNATNTLYKPSKPIDYDQQQQFELWDVDKKIVVYTPTYQRVYSESAFLSHVLGFVGKDKDGNDLGYNGVEQYYNGDLVGQSGQIYQAKSASGKAILWGESEKYLSVNGSDLYTTIDRTVQFITERHLQEGVSKYNAKSGTVIIVEPTTGNIIAMANFPDFIPSEYSKYADNRDLLRNNAIAVVYEPGSIIKAITMASALDAGKVALSDTYNDTGAKIYSGHKVDNWDGKHHGEETLEEILQHSNNLGAGWLGLRLGSASLMRYFKDFHFGQKLGIDIDGEENGIIYQNDNLKDIETVNASFGQGISLTPLQAVMAFSAIANDGYLMKPRIVNKIKNKEKAVNFKPIVQSRPISKNTADIMVGMLTKAVSGGEAKSFISKKYQIAGKTGTAQVPIKGGYDENRTNATFVGFLPSYKNFVMLVKLEEPSFPSGYASETAVPLWMKIAEDLASYYSLPSDK